MYNIYTYSHAYHYKVLFSTEYYFSTLDTYYSWTEHLHMPETLVAYPPQGGIHRTLRTARHTADNATQVVMAQNPCLPPQK